MRYEHGQRVVFTKRGESRYYDTEWPATYIKLTPAGRHSIRLDGQRRARVVRNENNLRPYIACQCCERPAATTEGLCGLDECTDRYRAASDSRF